MTKRLVVLVYHVTPTRPSHRNERWSSTTAAEAEPSTCRVWGERQRPRDWHKKLMMSVMARVPCGFIASLAATVTLLLRLTVLQLVAAACNMPHCICATTTRLGTVCCCYYSSYVVDSAVRRSSSFHRSTPVLPRASVRLGREWRLVERKDTDWRVTAVEKPKLPKR